MLGAAGAYWYFFVRQTPVKENNFETPIASYYKALESKDEESALKTCVPCASSNEELKTYISTRIADIGNTEDVTVKYLLDTDHVGPNPEVVSDADKRKILLID